MSCTECEHIMTKIDLDELVPSETGEGIVEAVKIGDLIRQNIKKIYFERAKVSYDLSSDGISKYLDEIVTILGIPKLTDEEFDDLDERAHNLYWIGKEYR